MDIDKIRRYARVIHERTDAASPYGDDQDSPMAVIRTIEDHIVAILHELGEPGFEQYTDPPKPSPEEKKKPNRVLHPFVPDMFSPKHCDECMPDRRREAHPIHSTSEN